MRDERRPDRHVFHIASDDRGLKPDPATVLIAQEQQAMRELIVDNVSFKHNFLPTKIPVVDSAQGLTVVL